MVQEMIEKKDIWRSLKWFFTEKEQLSMACSFANHHREKMRLEGELSSIKKQYASDIEKQDAEISSLAERLNTGWEMRRTECEEDKDFSNGTVTIWRKDTGVSVEDRPMTAEERQQTLPLNKHDSEIFPGKQLEPPHQRSQDASKTHEKEMDMEEPTKKLLDDTNIFYTKNKKSNKNKNLELI